MATNRVTPNNFFDARSQGRMRGTYDWDGGTLYLSDLDILRLTNSVSVIHGIARIPGSSSSKRPSDAVRAIMALNPLKSGYFLATTNCDNDESNELAQRVGGRALIEWVNPNTGNQLVLWGAPAPGFDVMTPVIEKKPTISPTKRSLYEVEAFDGEYECYMQCPTCGQDQRESGDGPEFAVILEQFPGCCGAKYVPNAEQGNLRAWEPLGMALSATLDNGDGNGIVIAVTKDLEGKVMYSAGQVMRKALRYAGMKPLVTFYDALTTQTIWVGIEDGCRVQRNKFVRK